MINYTVLKRNVRGTNAENISPNISHRVIDTNGAPHPIRGSAHLDMNSNNTGRPALQTTSATQSLIG